MLKHSITTAGQLAQQFPVDSQALQEVIERYPLRINPYYLGLIQQPGDPIWKQVVPDERELLDTGGMEEPLAQDKRRLSVGLQPASLATGDLDGDGTPDLAVSNGWISSDVSVLLGRGGGPFEAERRIPTSYYPSSVALGDFDGDGNEDMAVTISESRAVAVFPGQGDGTFGDEQLYSGGASFHVASGDLDTDGFDDLVLTSYADDELWVLKSQPPRCPRADDVPPVVTITVPEGGLVLTMPPRPVPFAFQTNDDDDGFSGGVEHERLLVDGCVVFDGAAFGDEDGLLSDEEIALDSGLLCRTLASGFCGNRQSNPSVRSMSIAAHRFSGLHRCG